MVQPNYNPEEALNRVKLMMGYDSSKTLTENKEAIGLMKENQLLNEIEPVTLVVGALAAASALGIGAAWAESSSEGNEKKVRKALEACDTSTRRAANDLKSKKTLSGVEHQKVANQFNTAFNWTLGGFGVGAGTDLNALRGALNTWATKGSFGDICEVRKLYNEEKEDGKKLEDDLIDELNDSELVEVTNAISLVLAKSKPGDVKEKDAGTRPVQWWLDEFECLEVSDSFVQPIEVFTDKYGNNYVKVNFKVGGQVKEFHLLWNHRIYTADSHKFTGKEVKCNGDKVGLKESVTQKKKSIDEQADLGNVDLRDRDEARPAPTSTQQRTPSPTPTPRRNVPPRPKFTPCENGRYIRGCSSEVVRQVQECLGFSVADQDGKFGKITQGALAKVGFAGGFRDKDVDKICNKVEADPSLGVVYSFDNPTPDNTTLPTAGVDNSVPSEVITNPR